MKSCRIVLADDHALIRQGIKKTLEDAESFTVIGEVADGVELLEFLKGDVPDIVVLDISMPNLNGIQAMSAVKELYPQVRILILTMHKSEQHLCSSIYAGANGYLLKEDSDTDLIPAIESVLRGELYISPALTEEFSDNIIRSCMEHQKASGDVLTAREKQILKLVAQGGTSRDIAESLAISKRTVEHHRASIMRKLNIKNAADLIKYAMSQGYI